MKNKRIQAHIDRAREYLRRGRRDLDTGRYNYVAQEITWCFDQLLVAVRLMEEKK
jgi:hypothetical protein